MAAEDAWKLGLGVADPVAGPLAGGQCFDSRPGLDSRLAPRHERRARLQCYRWGAARARV